MKKQIAVGAAAIAMWGEAAAQTDTTLFGLIDTTVRYSTNENANGDNRLQLTDGVLTGSRWGVRATEDLGSGLRAVAMLESGFSPDAGTMLQGGRLFGRQAFVGLDGSAGRLLFGRQYTLAHETLASLDAFAIPNNMIVGFQLNYSGVRNDNMVKYAKNVAGINLNASYTFGEVAGSTAANSAKAVSANYASGPWYVAAVYQATNNVTSAYYNAVTASQASKQTVWGLGGTYQFESVKAYLSYTDNKLDTADYRNQAIAASFNWKLMPDLELLGGIYYDRLRRTTTDGSRWTTAFMLDKYLSKRTDVYVEIDHTKLRKAWVGLANNVGQASANMFGHDSRTGIMAGIRHKF